MADPAVIVENEGEILVVTLNRPEKKNAVNCEVMCRLYDAWVRLDEEDALRVAILTGRGDTFCAGMDLGEIGKMRAGVADNAWMERVKKEPHVIFGAWLKTYRPGKPVILAAEGFAPGHLHVTDTESEALPTESGVQAFKGGYLNSLRAMGFEIHAAFGNATTDIGAYAIAGVPEARTWIIGENAGVDSTVPVADAWTEIVLEVSAWPAAEQPF